MSVHPLTANDIPPPGSVCIWSGAGVSADVPTALPLGDALTEAIIRRVCTPGTWEEVREDFQVAEMRSASGRLKETPRLEWVTEHLHRAVDDAVLQGFTAFCDVAPNELHGFFAEHLEAGGHHITLNFDRCIEKASRDTSSLVRLLHLHGVLGPADLGDIRTRALQLTGGLSFDAEASLVDVLATSELLVVLGYSGRDYFDVDPFFRRLASSGSIDLERLRVIWLEHSVGVGAPTPVDWKREAVIDGRPILDSLQALGASVAYFRGPTRTVLQELATCWGLRPPRRASSPAQAACARHLERAASKIRVDPSDRLRATAVFWFSMGAGRHIVELDRRLAASTEATDREARESIAEIRRDGLQSVGLYRQALRLARKIDDPARRHGAMAGGHRLRGDYGWSLFHVLQALLLCSGPHSPDPLHADYCGDAREAFVAWYRTARNGSSGWLLASLRKGLFRAAKRLRLHRLEQFDPVVVFEKFRDCRPYLDGHPHAVEQISRAWREVPEFAAVGPLPDAVASRQVDGAVVFVETDHFLGYLNGERGRLAQRVFAAKGRGVASDPNLRPELLKHRRQAVHQGDLPGELKASLLERVAGGDGRPFPKGALLGVEWNFRTKLQWLMRWWRRSWYPNPARSDPLC